MHEAGHIDRRLKNIKGLNPGPFYIPQKPERNPDPTSALDRILPPRIQFTAGDAGPPSSTSSSFLARMRHARETQQSNSMLQRKLLARWALRTSLYSPPPPPSKIRPCSSNEAATNITSGGGGSSCSSRSKAAAAAASYLPLPEPPCYTANLEAASVPKSLGMASCSGCAVKCFYNADGRKLSRCRMCKQAWYCSETCAKSDWQGHRGLCKLNSNGFWSAFGPRPNEEYWVTNSAQAGVRRALQHRQPTDDPETEVEAQHHIQMAYRAARSTEVAAEQRQRHVEQLSLEGLDGPRPCMHRYGKPDTKVPVQWCGETIRQATGHTKLLPPRPSTSKPEQPSQM
ncbi:MAG: hypothetical protein WDW38_006823 [Sanguina aurantia]